MTGGGGWSSAILFVSATPRRRRRDGDREDGRRCLRGHPQTEQAGLQRLRGGDRSPMSRQYLAGTSVAETVERLVAVRVDVQAGPFQGNAGEQAAAARVGKNLRLQESPLRRHL